MKVALVTVPSRNDAKALPVLGTNGAWVPTVLLNPLDPFGGEHGVGFLLIRPSDWHAWVADVPVLGLREGGVGLAPAGGDAIPAITPEMRSAALADVERLRAAIIAGKVRPPATLDELARFKPPDPAELGLAHAVAARP